MTKDKILIGLVTLGVMGLSAGIALAAPCVSGNFTIPGLGLSFCNSSPGSHNYYFFFSTSTIGTATSSESKFGIGDSLIPQNGVSLTRSYNISSIGNSTDTLPINFWIEDDQAGLCNAATQDALTCANQAGSSMTKFTIWPATSTPATTPKTPRRLKGVGITR